MSQFSVDMCETIPPPNNRKNHQSISRELTRLISAAVVDDAFCQKLLANPLAAAHSGYGSYRFKLTSDEVKLLSSIDAPLSLVDLARQLVANNDEGSQA